MVRPELEELPATSYAIMGVLSFGEMSGYDIKKYAQTSIAWFYWSPAQSQIYAELRRLERHKLAVSRVDTDDTSRKRRLYALTPLGVERLRHWIAQSEEPAVLKHGTMLRLWAGAVADEDAIDSLIDEYESWCHERLARLGGMRRAALRVDEWRYPAIVAGWGVRHFEAELANLAQLRVELEQVRARERDRPTQ